MPLPPGHEKPQLKGSGLSFLSITGGKDGLQCRTSIQRRAIFQNMRNSTPLKLALSALLAGLILLLDLSLPVGVAGGGAYMALVFMGYLFEGPRPSFVLAGLGSVLVLLGLFFRNRQPFPSSPWPTRPSPCSPCGLRPFSSPGGRGGGGYGSQHGRAHQRAFDGGAGT